MDHQQDVKKATETSPLLLCANSLLQYYILSAIVCKRKWHSNFPSNQIISSL